MTSAVTLDCTSGLIELKEMWLKITYSAKNVSVFLCDLFHFSVSSATLKTFLLNAADSEVVKSENL